MQLAFIMPMNPDQVLLVIVFDSSKEGKTCKIHIRARDLPESSSSTISGKQLHAMLLEGGVGGDSSSTSNNKSVIDIYDPIIDKFQSLDLEEIDIAARFGKCIRCTTSYALTTTNDPPPAIMGRYFPYDASTGLEIAGTRLRVQETPNIPGAGTGLNVWDGAMLLARYLEARPELVRGKRVLELGAGCGLVGISTGILGASEVVLTDLPYCLSLMQHNVNHHYEVASTRGCQRMECTVCDWFDPPSLNEFGSDEEEEWNVDVILVADCVWVQELVQPLLNTLKKLTAKSKSHPIQVIVSYQQRGKDAHEEFWHGIHSLFTVVDEINTVNVEIKKPACLHLFECCQPVD